MPSLLYLKLTDKLACQSSPTVYGVLHPEELLSGKDTTAVEDQESLSFSYAYRNALGEVRAISAQMRAARVITLMWSDGTFDEWRVGPVITGRGEGGKVTVTCVPLWLDLVERSNSSTGQGWVSDLSAGVRNFEYEVTDRTASSILSTYVIPACPSYVALGTVDPTNVLPTLSVSRLTPGALTLAVRDALRAVDVSCEVRLRRNGTTNYLLDLVTQIGASATVPVFHPNNSLLTLQQKSDPTLQATRVLVKGGTSPDGQPGIWGRARWRCGTASGNVIPVTDWNGGAGPIAFDGEFVGSYLRRVQTGATFLITASAAAANTVTLGGGASNIAADESVEFVRDEPLTNTRRIGAADVTGVSALRIYDITGVASGVLTLANRFKNTFITNLNPVAANGENTDWMARRMTLILETGMTSPAVTSGGLVSGCNSVTGVLPGDIVVFSSSATAPYLFTTIYDALVVDTVNAGPKTLQTHTRDGGSIFANTFSARMRVYRPVATLHRITNSNASASTFTVDSVGTATTADAIEVIQIEGAGETPSFVDHPVYAQADPVGYGIKAVEISKAAIGSVQLAPNAWMRQWTTSGSPPDGWTKTGAGTSSRNASAAFTRFGGYSYRLQGPCDVRTPVTYHDWAPGRTALSGRAWVYCATFSGDIQLAFTIFARTPAGGIGKVLGSVIVTPADSTLNYTRVSSGAWIELKVEGITLPLGDSAPYGVHGQVTIDTGAPDVYLDVVELYPFTTCPSDGVEYGDATRLLQSGNRQLGIGGSPPLYFAFQVLDLERAFPDEYQRNALTLGGNVRAPDLDYGIDVTVRLLTRVRDLLNDTKTDLTLANRATRLTTIQGATTAQQSRIVAAVQASAASNQSSGPAFVQLTGATVLLTTDAEIATPTGGSTTIILPPVAPPPVATPMADTAGASVTYIPPDPTTTPQTVVTVGTPPSRRTPRILEE